MQTDPDRDQDSGQEQKDATNQGVSPTEPAEGADDASALGPDSPGQ